MMTVLSYVLAVAGLGLVALQVIAAQMANVHYPFERVTLINLLRTDPHRAEAQCRALPNTFYAPIGAAIAAAAMAQSRDPAAIAAANRPAYDAAAMAAASFWKMALTKGKLGVGLAGGAIVLDPAKGVPTLFVIMAVIAAGGLGWVWWRAEAAERSVVLARAEVLPEVDRVFVGGHY
ncbi:MAG: hypothetical protein R2939_21500 [Kofleriaceae bacterium]